MNMPVVPESSRAEVEIVVREVTGVSMIEMFIEQGAFFTAKDTLILLGFWGSSFCVTSVSLSAFAFPSSFDWV